MQEIPPSILEELQRRDAVLTDLHFVYKSGKHGSGYINLDPVFPDAELMLAIGRDLVQPWLGRFDVLAAPAVGGVALVAYAASAAAQLGEAVSAVWADKTESGFAVERTGFADHIGDRRVLLIEDLLTTGGSVKAVAEAVDRCGGKVAGASVICNRGGVTAEDIGVSELVSLAEVDLGAVDAIDCPLCAHRRPIVENVGHGAEFKRANPTYSGGFITLRSAGRQSGRRPAVPHQP